MKKDTLHRMAIVFIAIFGLALTLWLFFPGILSYDAAWIYKDISEGRTPGDWQSPVMAAIWSAIDPWYPGPGSIFLLTVLLYWGGLAGTALLLVGACRWVAVTLPLLGMLPPALLELGVIWRDTLMASAWLAASALGLAAASTHHRGSAIALRACGLLLVIVGLLLRPNALFAAPFLVGYLLNASDFNVRRLALVFVASVIAGIVVIQVVFYGLLDAQRQHPGQAILVFDLGGIAHFSRQNPFPGTWTEEQNARLTGDCYDPSQWDGYWRIYPCPFVMRKLEREGIFGTPELVSSWYAAVLSQPTAYLKHRFSHFFSLLTVDSRTGNLRSFAAVNDPEYLGRIRIPLALEDHLKSTPLFQVGTWLAAAILIFVIAAANSKNRLNVFAASVSASAIVYVTTFLFFGVASEFRYGYWALLAALTGGAAVASGACARRMKRVSPAALSAPGYAETSLS